MLHHLANVGIARLLPTNFEQLIISWKLPKSSPLDNQLWKLILPSVYWNLWLERNQRCFESYDIPSFKVFSKARDNWCFWATNIQGVNLLWIWKKGGGKWLGTLYMIFFCGLFPLGDILSPFFINFYLSKKKKKRIYPPFPISINCKSYFSMTKIKCKVFTKEKKTLNAKRKTRLFLLLFTKLY